MSRRGQVDPHVKAEAIRLAKVKGPKAAADELDLSPGTVRSWLSREKHEAPRVAALAADGDEVERLKQLAKVERSVAKRFLYLATQNQPPVSATDAAAHMRSHRHAADEADRLEQRLREIRAALAAAEREREDRAVREERERELHAAQVGELLAEQFAATVRQLLDGLGVEIRGEPVRAFLRDVLTKRGEEPDPALAEAAREAVLDQLAGDEVRRRERLRPPPESRIVPRVNTHEGGGAAKGGPGV